MAQLKFQVGLVGERGVEGYVFDADDLERRFVVELLVDGLPMRLTRANRFDPALRDGGFGDGCFRFRFDLDEATARAGGLAEVRLANSLASFAEPRRLGAAAPVGAGEGRAQWDGGLMFSGWVAAAGAAAPKLRAEVDGIVVAETFADRWTFAGEAPARGFELHLPLRFADGRARRARILDEMGADLPGSPCDFLAFADGLERFLAERAEIAAEAPRGAIYDSLFPRACPMREFAAWALRFPPPEPAPRARIRAAVVLYGVDGVEASVASLAAQQGAEWTAATFGEAAFDVPPAALAKWASEDGAGAEFFVLAPAGTIFHPTALAHLAGALAAHPKAALAYADAAFAAADGSRWPLAFPAFDYERCLEQGYAAICFAARRPVIETAARDGLSDPFALFLSALPAEAPATAGAVVHAPGFVVDWPALDLDAAARRLAGATVAHLDRRGHKATATLSFSGLLPAVRTTRPAAPGPVSVAVATYEAPDKLREFLAEFSASLGGARADAIVIDLGSKSPDALAALDEAGKLGARVVRLSGARSPERAFNAAATISTAEFLALATTDMTPPPAGWLAEALGRLSEPDVAAVAPSLISRSGVVSQSGWTLGPGFAAARAFGDLGDGDLGYGEALAAAREASAASALGLVVKRKAFNDLGGFDLARFPFRYAAVDFCLRLRARGQRLVVTPHIRWGLDRAEDRELENDAELGDRLRREIETLRAIWGEALAADPFYNPQLALAGAPFSALAWPPRPMTPRLPALPPARDWPHGL